MQKTAMLTKDVTKASTESGLCTLGMLFLALLLGGPIAGGYLLAKNYRILGEPDKAKMSIFYSVFFIFCILIALLLLPDSVSVHVPSGALPAIYGFLYASYFRTKQNTQINELLKQGRKKMSYWRVLWVAVVALTLTTIMGISIYVAKEGGFTLKEVQQYNQGVNYEQGTGVEQSYSKAADFFKKAADADLPEGEYALATLYLHGKGVSQNSKLAIKWLLKASDQGYARAQLLLAVLYQSGLQGVEQNHKLAIKYLKLASANGNKKAKELLRQP